MFDSFWHSLRGCVCDQIAACDQFTYIQQYTKATASLNVAVAGSIVLHHFALASGMPVAERKGQKFVTDEGRGKLDRYEHPTDYEQQVIEEKRRLRAAKRQKEAVAPADDDGKTA